MTTETGYVDIEQEERYAAAKMSANVAQQAEKRLKKLATVMSRLAILDSTAKQIHLVESGLSYVSKIKDDMPQPLKSSVNSIRNELMSIKEGLRVGALEPSDLVVLSMTAALKSSIQLTAKTKSRVEAISFGNQEDEAMRILQRNQRFKESMPALNGRDFVVARCPVSFTFQNKQKHGGVGYIDKDLLGHLGFKAELLDGYAVIHNQVVIGVNPRSVYNIEKALDGEQKEVTTQTPIIVNEKVVTFKAGKPTTVTKRRPKVVLDVARELLGMLSRNTGIPYELVSEYGAGFKGASWFWVMPAKDIVRLGKAFPGGHIKLAKWGFAF